jgi:methionine-rich copper-binding protein CopC
LPITGPFRLRCFTGAALFGAMLVGVILVGLMLASTGAMAHAILEQSRPPAGGSVPAGKVDMSFIYNSRIDRDRSRLTITSPDQKQAVMQLDPDGPPNVIDTSAELNKPGAYVVRWQVLAVDGHITRGDVPFTVTGP